MLSRFSLLTALLLVGQDPAQVSKTIRKSNDCHVETRFTSRMRADYHMTIRSPETTTGRLKEYALVPPDTETQKLVECHISCREFPDLKESVVGDVNDPSRKYKVIEIPVDGGVLGQPIHIDITYVVDVYKAVLRRGSGATQTIEEGERKRALAETPLVDYNSPAFQAYLRQNDLLKHASESDFDFAFRAYQILAKEIAGRTIEGKTPEPGYVFKASHVTGSTCKVGGCGDCSVAFTGVLRANGIPSRLLVGRWALNQDDKNYGQWHVRSDFFIPSMGWVLVDQTFAMLGVRARSSDAYTNFGGENPDFITMHTNSEVHPVGSNFEMPVHQFGVASYSGSSVFKPTGTESWTVSRVQQGVVETFDSFEDGYKSWQIEGDAFGFGPAEGALVNQQRVVGYSGRRLVNSFSGGDAAQGVATSRTFTITHPYIRFLIGGGQDRNLVGLQLVVNGRVVRSATGKNSEELSEAEWDVSSYMDKQAYFRIIDLSSDGWGHILVDAIGFADQSMNQN